MYEKQKPCEVKDGKQSDTGKSATLAFPWRLALLDHDYPEAFEELHREVYTSVSITQFRRKSSVAWTTAITMSRDITRGMKFHRILKMRTIAFNSSQKQSPRKGRPVEGKSTCSAWFGAFCWRQKRETIKTVHPTIHQQSLPLVIASTMTISYAVLKSVGCIFLRTQFTTIQKQAADVRREKKKDTMFKRRTSCLRMKSLGEEMMTNSESAY